MLSKRYFYDRKPLLLLNKLQLKIKNEIEKKISNKIYTFQKINCVICNSNDFQLLSEKDRYGLYMPVVICKRCGLVQTNPRMNQKSYNKFYDSEYSKLYVGEEKPTENFFSKQYNHGAYIYDYITKFSGASIQNKFIVELGTGAGGILQYFKEKNNEVYGVDLDSEYIEFGKQKGLNLEVGTIDKLYSLRKKPDVVIYSHIVEHLLNPVNDMKKLKRLLNQDGLLYIEVPGVKNLYDSYSQNFLKYLQNAHTYHFTLNSLTNCAKKAGFKMLSGDEFIHSVFKKGNADKNYKSDYALALAFLKKLEKDRTNILNYRRLRSKIISAAVALPIKTRTFGIARKIYYLIK